MSRFVRVGRVDEFRDRRGRAVPVGDTKVAVFRLGDRWYAIQDACPHMGASLADGKIEGGSVVCHWHEWRYELGSGRNDVRKDFCARTYRVRVDDGEVLVECPPPAEHEAESGEEDDEWMRWDPDRFFKKKSGPGDRG